MDERVLAGRYQLTAQLARGGVGIVWRATDLVLDREVAVKELRLPGDVSEAERVSLLSRTTQEARVAAQLTHYNVVEIYDVVNEDGRPWIVMELVVARTLAEIIEVAGPLPHQRVAEIGLQLISALQTAHEQSIVHRDVKPENVMISEDGRVVLTDFGLAVWSGESSLTNSGRIIGSPHYIPPERARAGTVGSASDLWSLGATLYTAVEGHPPYDRKGYIAILRGEELDDPPPASSAGPLRPLLEGLLRPDPEDRLTAQNAAKMLRIAALAPATSVLESEDGQDPDDVHGADDSGAADAGTSGNDGQRDVWRASATQFTTSVQESVSSLSDSVQSSVSSALYRGSHERRPEAVNPLLSSIRDSTDSLGLTSSGKHRTRHRRGVIAVVALSLLLLLTMVVGLLVS
ncbi:serine/threonine-protein kinase [Lipingzhangella sp. LS1_29]|uniref:non-specific serine/threonine protein kinase n=1 Tax=Lipingzhangella rawalii TaxID=2055835 RepID=A0ABU2H9M7_9ACTN|nr:serine/threonine-protein kinase [Lipingzhangella rawalii]MDS1271968.1 serine/threonine-protein kinase [Lipingzhangella rawalii]